MWSSVCCPMTFERAGWESNLQCDGKSFFFCCSNKTPIIFKEVPLVVILETARFGWFQIWECVIKLLASLFAFLIVRLTLNEVEEKSVLWSKMLFYAPLGQ